jgi:MYXO-CTERM domain-containing protein
MRGLAIVAGLSVSASVASAAVVFSDDFEGDYANGDQVAIHTPDIGLQWTGSTNSVLRDNTNTPAPSGTGGAFYASLNDRIIGQLNAADIPSTANATMYITFDFYVASDTGNGLDFITFAPSPGYRGPDFLLRPNGTFAHYTNASNTYTTDANFNFAADAWQSASLVVNYGTGAASLTVGAETVNFTVADPNSTSMREIYFINTNDNQNVVGVDNIIISTTPVPEPAGVALIGLGALAALRGRRRA